MKLYSLNGAKPAPLPFRITLPNGRTRTDPSTFTAKELADAGFVEKTAAPSFDPDAEKVEWSNGSWSKSNLSTEEKAAKLAAYRETLVLSRGQFAELLIRRQIEVNGSKVSLQAPVEAALNAIKDPVEKAVALAWYEKEPTVRRTSKRVEAIRAGLGISEADTDAWFAAAMLYT